MKNLLRQKVSRYERRLVQQALLKHGSQSRAAEALQMSRQNLWARMKQLGITLPDTSDTACSRP